MAEIYVNDWGTVFEVTLVDENDAAIDVSLATTQEIRFRKPDGVMDVQTSVFTTDGTDGKIEYTTVAGDLDVAGRWSIQGHVILPTGDWQSAIGEFHVRENA